ncbi:MAG: hypothetical protein RBS57_15480 [Desulforhabdus sp.]|jgi:WD40 repeat protein|nr:hypothetical protein [Desulforhabdus sp.]
MQIAQVSSYCLGDASSIVSHAMISGDGELFGALVDGHPVLVRFDRNPVELPPEIMLDSYTAAALSSDGMYLALGTNEALKIVEIASRTIRIATVEAIHHLVWHADEPTLVVGHQQNKLSFWNSSAECEGKINLPVPRSQRNWRVVFDGDENRVFAVSSFPTPNWLCVSSSTQCACKLRLPDESFMHDLIAWQQGVLGVLSDHAMRFTLVPYTTELKPQLVEPMLLETDITALAASPDTRWIAAGTVEGELWILDAETLKIVTRRSLFLPHPIHTLATCAADYVVAGSEDGYLKFIELFT